MLIYDAQECVAVSYRYSFASQYLFIPVCIPVASNLSRDPGNNPTKQLLSQQKIESRPQSSSYHKLYLIQWLKNTKFCLIGSQRFELI